MKNIHLETYFSEELSTNIDQAINDITNLMDKNIQQLKYQHQIEEKYRVGESTELRFIDQKDMIRHHLLLLESILDQLMIDDWYTAEPWPIDDHRSEIMNIDQVMSMISNRLKTTAVELIPLRTLILQVIDQNATKLINQYQASQFGASYAWEVLLEQLKSNIKMTNITLAYTSKSIKFVRPNPYSHYNSLVTSIELILLTLQMAKKIDCQQDLQLLRNGFQLDEVTCKNEWLKSVKFYQNGNALLTCRSQSTKNDLLCFLRELDSFKYKE